MKIKKLKEDPKETITLRISASVIKEITARALREGTSRQKLVEAILRSALANKGLVVEL